MKLFKWITVDLLNLLIIYDLKKFWWLLRWIRKNILIIIFIKLWNNSSMLVLLFLIQNLISLTNITRFTTRLQFLNNFKIICNWKAVLIILRRWLLGIIVWIICWIEFLLSLSAVSCSVSISNINQSSFYNCFMLQLFNLIILTNFVFLNQNFFFIFYQINWGYRLILCKNVLFLQLNVFCFI
jgi:hypothetical protein